MGKPLLHKYAACFAASAAFILLFCVLCIAGSATGQSSAVNAADAESDKPPPPLVSGTATTKAIKQEAAFVNETGNLMDTLRTLGYTVFADDAAQFPDLLAILAPSSTTTNFTVFVPTNEAMGQIPAELMHDTLAYHISSGTHLLNSLQWGDLLESALVLSSLGGRAQRLAITTDVTVSPVIQGVGVYGNETLATNGVIIPIKDVIHLPSPLLKVPLSPPLSQFATAMNHAQYTSRFSRNNITFIAPSNAAFNKLTPAQFNYLTVSSAGITDTQRVLDYFIFQNGIVYSTDMPNGTTIYETQDEGASITIDKTVDSITVNGAALTYYDVVGSNGVMHITDTLIFPPNFVFTVDKDMLGLELKSASAAVNRAKLSSYLTDLDTPVAIFAPDDTAFADFSDHTIGDIASDELRHIMERHIVVDYNSTLDGELYLTTMSGEVLIVSADARYVSMEGTEYSAEIYTGPSRAVNGAVYVINAVLAPPLEEEEEEDDDGFAITTDWRIVVVASSVVGAIFLVCGGGWYTKQYIDARRAARGYDPVTLRQSSSSPNL